MFAAQIDSHGHILGVSAYTRKAQMPTDLRDDLGMKKAADTVVIENLAVAMLHKGIVNKSTAEPSQSEMARRSGVDQRTVGRILKGELSPTLGTLEKLVGPLGLHVWQLLIPNLDPGNPPVFVMSSTERTFYDRMRSSFREIAAQEPGSKYSLSQHDDGLSCDRRVTSRRATDSA